MGTTNGLTRRGWTRDSFALAMAVQKLAWGLAGPFAGALADRFGAVRVLWAGGLLYAAGLVMMGLATSGLAFPGLNGLFGLLVAYWVALLVQLPFSRNFATSWAVFIDRIVQFSAMALFIAVFVRAPTALKVFLGAFLLFQIQPLISR